MWQQNLASIRIRICIGLVFNVWSKYASCICHFFVKKPTPDQHWPKMLNPAPPIKNWIRHPGMNISGTVLMEQETCSSRGHRPARRSQQSSPHQPAQPQEPWTPGILNIQFLSPFNQIFIIHYTRKYTFGTKVLIIFYKNTFVHNNATSKNPYKEKRWLVRETDPTFYRLIFDWLTARPATTEFCIITGVSASCLGWQRYLTPSLPFSFQGCAWQM